MAVNILMVDDSRAVRSMIAKTIRKNLALSNILHAIVPAHAGANNGNRALKKGGSA
jgi:hypothetical protein